MKPKALVVEDDPKIPALLKPKFVALKHDFDVATNLQAAREMVAKGGYNLALVDLTIPADEDGDFPDKQYGLIFIQELRARWSKEELPIIAMTSYADVGFGLSTELHEMSVNACISKNLENMQSLVKVIRSVLANPAGSKPKAEKGVLKLEHFSAKQREMLIFEERITLCGAEVWRDCGQTDMRDTLALLRAQDKHGYVRINGPKLGKKLGRLPTNPIGRPISDLCKRFTEVMLKRGIDSGRDAVIKNDGGYHFREWMVVRVIGEWAKALGIEPDELANEPGEPVNEPARELGEPAGEPVNEPAKAPVGPLNDRQQWVMSQVTGGVRISQKDVIAHFRTKWNASTVKRDLKDLRDKGLLTTNESGYYVPGKGGVIKPTGSPAAPPSRCKAPAAPGTA